MLLTKQSLIGQHILYQADHFKTVQNLIAVARTHVVQSDHYRKRHFTEACKWLNFTNVLMEMLVADT